MTKAYTPSCLARRATEEISKNKIKIFMKSNIYIFYFIFASGSMSRMFIKTRCNKNEKKICEFIHVSRPFQAKGYGKICGMPF
jgi:hypothetical protein